MRKINPSYYFILPIIFPLMFCTSQSNAYQVKATNSPINITGKGTDGNWDQANLLTNFSYPWRSETPPKTAFKALYDDTHLYFLYRATDPDIILKERGLGEKDAVDSDRVELFFKANDEMNPYYSLELDALGRILDTEGKFYRKIDFEWTWPANQLIVKASRDATGYWVEGSISFRSLRQLGMYRDDRQLQVGLYRAEYIAKADGTTEPKWISWIKPDSEKPDFHIPSSFGIFELME